MKTIVAILIMFAYFTLTTLAGLLLYGAHRGNEALRPEDDEP